MNKYQKILKRRVHYRVGSLEIGQKSLYSTQVVHYRVGSLEKQARYRA